MVKFNYSKSTAVCMSVIAMLILLNVLSYQNTTTPLCTYMEDSDLDQMITDEKYQLLQYSKRQHHELNDNKSNHAVSGKLFTGRKIRNENLITLNNNFKFRNFDFKEECTMQVVSVVTTLNPQAPCILDTAITMPVVIVGDKGISTPTEHKNVIYLSLANQSNLFPSLSQIIPLNNFARKNLGYLYALIYLKACFVYDFDDDNCLGPELKNDFNPKEITTKHVFWAESNDHIVNPYLIYGSPEFIWPRGYPIDLIGKRIWPALTNEISKLPKQVDVVQFIQSVDPDVDATWRLMYGDKTLPMQWKTLKRIENNLIGIKHGNFAPFNAQATLFSRRALVTAYLPWTVHGRVSDIWRSFIMQYFLGSYENPGHVSFSGHNVFHYRTSHNWLADMDAEHQLNNQAHQFLNYIAWKKDFVSIQEFFNELYSREYIEQGDLNGIQCWLELIIPLLNVSTNLENTHVVFPKTFHWKRHNVLSVLHINTRHIEVLPVWMAIYGHNFKSGLVKVYLPGLTPCKGLSGIEIHCISDDWKGYFAYESLIHAIKNADSNEKVDGYLFFHDDVLWNTEKLDFHNNISAITRFQSAQYGADVSINHYWPWWNSQWGLQAMKSFQIDYGCSIKESSYYRSWSDFYFISNKDKDKFVNVGSVMRKHEIFLEIAVPTIFWLFIKPHQTMLKNKRL